jgi:hypothetical protein
MLDALASCTLSHPVVARRKRKTTTTHNVVKHLQGSNVDSAMRARCPFIIFIDFETPVLNLPIRSISRVANGVKKCEENFAMKSERMDAFAYFALNG